MENILSEIIFLPIIVAIILVILKAIKNWCYIFFYNNSHFSFNFNI